MINSKLRIKTIGVPLGDYGKHQHFSAADDPACSEHFNQCRENVTERACGGAGFHSAIRICRLCEQTFVTENPFANCPRCGERLQYQTDLPLSRHTLPSRAPGCAKAWPFSLGDINVVVN